MASLSKVLSELAAARRDGMLDRYAIGGAVGATFYVEPAATEDVDIFVTMVPKPGSILVTLEPLYSYFKARGATVEGERLVIGGWLVQLLPPPTELVVDALDQAKPMDVEGVEVPVFTPEHLAAIALETNRAKDRIRLQQFLESEALDRRAFDRLIERFGLTERWLRTKALLEESE
jgi:hypothetical protein